jgi:hypothetical protein
MPSREAFEGLEVHMDMVLGISMAPTMVRLVLVEGQNADGVTVEEDHFAVAAAPADRVIAAIVGTREGATEGGCRLTSTGVTWTDSAEVGALRDAIASHDVGRVMLVSPLLAAAGLAHTVGDALDYEHIAMLYVERESATLATVEVADGSIVDVRRQPLAGAVAAELAAMVAGVDGPASRANGVFVVGCGADVVAIKAALEAATGVEVIVPEEPDMALARGAALASASAPLFASSTAALAYSLDPGTGEVNPGALSSTYLDVFGNADPGDGALAYGSLEDFAVEDGERIRRRPFVLAGSALAAVAAGLVVVSLTSDGRPAPQPTSRAGAGASAARVPPSEAQLPAPGPPPPAPALAAPPAPAPEVAAPEVAPPAPEVAAPPAPPPRHVPRRAPQSVPAPVQQAPAPPPPAAPPPEPVAPPPQYQRPPRTFWIRLPFVPVPIPIHPPAPQAPPPPAQ